uniref:Uncharacterized protein MANES_16G040500 n=1 Tax=Rhizophora mucronata TaxID=61149 RepID=A0A2P2QQA1_RHIMU
MSFFIFDKCLSLNSSLLKSANLFNPTSCPEADLFFAFLSRIYFKLLRKFSSLFSASSACLYTLPCFCFHS